MVVKLLVVEGNTAVKEVTLRRPRTVAGRKKGCKLRIRSELVSRIHCSLIREGDRLRVKDLGSSNGTYVNGVRITEAALTAGDVIQVGPVKFVVQIIDSESPTQKPAQPVAPTVKLPDGEVVFFESDDSADDAEGIVEADLLGELDDAPEFATQGAGDSPVAGPESIFSEEGEVLDAGQFLIPDDEAGDGGGGGYKLADPPDKRDPNPRR